MAAKGPRKMFSRIWVAYYERCSSSPGTAGPDRWTGGRIWIAAARDCQKYQRRSMDQGPYSRTSYDIS